MVRGGRRLSLSQRILKICRSKKNANLETKLEEYQRRDDWQDPSSQVQRGVWCSWGLVCPVLHVYLFPGTYLYLLYPGKWYPKMMYPVLYVYLFPRTYL